MTCIVCTCNHDNKCPIHKKEKDVLTENEEIISNIMEKKVKILQKTLNETKKNIKRIEERIKNIESLKPVIERVELCDKDFFNPDPDTMYIFYVNKSCFRCRELDDQTW